MSHLKSCASNVAAKSFQSETAGLKWHRLALLLFSVLVLMGARDTYATPVPAATTIYLTPSYQGHAVMTVPAGSLITFTAQVFSGDVAVKWGQVNLCQGPAAHCTGLNLLGTAQLTSAGTAVFKLHPRIGTESFKAVFLGTKAYATSTSQQSTLNVTGTLPSTTAITSAGTPGNYSLTATVSGHGLQIPSGSVSFLDTSNGNTVVGTGSLVPQFAPFSFNNIAQSLQFNTVWEFFPQIVATADFNGDGFPDLVAQGEGNVAVLLGNGDGTFRQPNAVFAAGPLGGSFTTGDYNSDGNVDIVYSTITGGSVSFTTMLGDGAGNFTSTTMAGNNMVSYIGAGMLLTGDCNGDGIADLVFTGWAGTTTVYPYVACLSGANDGTFKAAVNSFGSSSGFASGQLGDFNGDGKLDVLVVRTSGANPMQILLGNGIGGFTASTTKITQGLGSNVLVSDLNGDGYSDLVFIDSSRNLTTLFSKGDGTFNAPVTTPSIQYGGTLALIDLYGNNIPDVILSQTNTTLNGPGSVLVFDGNGDGTYTPHANPGTATQYDWVSSVAVADFDGDGLPDIAATSYYYQPTGYQAQGGGSLSIFQEQTNYTAAATATGISPAGAGAHLIKASYSGDTFYDPSDSGTTSITGLFTGPQFSIPAGTYSGSQTVVLSDTTPGAKIYYALHGVTPTTSSTLYSGPITVATTTTVRAIAVAAGYPTSPVSAATYTISPTPSAIPEFSLPGGTYSGTQTVTLTSATPGATIYYALHGMTPTTSSTPYTGPISVSATTTIRAIAVAPGYAQSPVAAATYTISNPAAAPVFSQAGGTYSGTQTISLTDATPGVTIYYALHGATPTTASTPYTGPITVSSTTTIRAIAVATGYSNSAVAAATYTIQ